MDATHQGRQTKPDARTPGDRLDSWKEISGYLQRGIRTLQRLEKEAGLPVYRIPEHSGTVYAFRSELDAWFLGRPEIPILSRVLRFGFFDLDLSAGELRKSGLKVRLQDQPFQLLATLAANPGKVVTRDELKEKLWPDDTYVDFDRSLNTAASKLREALGDSASNPHFVETLPRRGYRFLASVESGSENRQQTDTQRLLATATSPADTASRLHRRLRIALALSLVLLCAAVIGIVSLWRAARDTINPADPLRFSFSPQSDSRAVISPDGRHIALLASGGQGLWIRDLNREEPRRIMGIDSGLKAIWSPDSRFIAVGGGGELKRVAVDGGPVITLCKLPIGTDNGATWSPDGGSIVVSAGSPHELYEIPAEGGEPRLLLTDSRAGTLSDPVWPYFLPTRDDRRVLLFNAGWRGDLVLWDLDSDEKQTLTRQDDQTISRPIYSSSGHLLYQSGSDLWALPFSIDRLDSAGEAFPVAMDVEGPSVSEDGTLVYQDPQEQMRRLVWRDREGNELGRVGQPQRRMLYPALSPDETRIAVAATQDGDEEIWIHHTQREMKTRLTFHPGLDRGPIWSPSGKEIVLASSRNGNMDVFLKAADGSGQVIPLVALQQSEFATDWSKDGKHVLYDRYHPETRSDIWDLSQKTDDDGFDATPFLATKFAEKAAKLSPDRRYAAYVSNEAGENHVYVQPFPEGGSRWQVSQGVGTQPRWRRDGRELFFVEGSTLFAAPVRLAPSFSAGTPAKLFQSPSLIGGASPRYDVSADGQRFVVAEPIGGVSAVHVVQNWFEEFRDREQD